MPSGNATRCCEGSRANPRDSVTRFRYLFEDERVVPVDGVDPVGGHRARAESLAHRVSRQTEQLHLQPLPFTNGYILLTINIYLRHPTRAENK